MLLDDGDGHDSTVMASAEAGPSTFKRPRDVLYCDVCRLPPEYCEFGPRLSKCKKWLEDKHPALFSSLYSEAVLDANMQALTVEQREKLSKDAAKMEAKADKKEEQRVKKMQEAKVTIKRIERTKRKHITAIHGLELFDIDLKKAAKLFANRFATGSSVSKNNQGEDEIVIQGDVADEVEELLQDKSSKIAAVLGGGKIPEDNVDIVEVKKKKSEE